MLEGGEGRKEIQIKNNITGALSVLLGIDLTDGYENLSLNVEEFENKSVLILGNSSRNKMLDLYENSKFRSR